MASTELVVAFSAQVQGLETSLKRVNTRLDEIMNKSAQTANKLQADVGIMSRAFDSLTSNLRSALAAYVAFSTVRSLAQLAVGIDDINASLNRMRILTQGTQGNVEALFASFNRLGAQTGQSVANIAEQFTRFYVATAGLGASQGQVEQLVSTLQRFAQISGRGPQEAGAAITQLSQGLASGRLNGDELRSILENMPQLAQALARQLNVGVGELRQMGEEGKLTAEVVFPALLRAGNDLGNRLEGLPLSLRQSFQVATDGLMRALREADRTIGASEWLSRALQWVGRAGQATAVAIGGGAPGAEAQRVAEGEIASSLERRRTLEREILEIRTQMANADQRAANVLQGQINLRERELARLPELSTNADAIDRALRNAALSVEGTYEDTARYFDGLRENNQRVVNETNRLRAQIDDAFRIREDARKKREEVESLRRRGLAQAETDALLRQINDREREELASLARREGADDRRNAAAARAAQARALEEQRALDAQVRAITGLDRSPVRDMEDRFRAISERQAGRSQSSIDVYLDRVLAGTQQLETLFGALETSAERAATELTRAGQSPAEAFTELNRQVDILRQRMEAKGIDTSGLEAQFQGATDRINDKLVRLRDRTESTWNDIAVKGAQAFSQDLAGGIVDFVATGEQKFGELAANFTKNIAKMILQLLIFQATASVLSSQFGVRIPGFANGGATPRGPIIVGERGPELFYPGSSGYIVPNHDLGGGGGTTVNVYNQAAGTTTRQQERSNGLGGKEIDIYIEQIVQRGITSGRFDSAFGQSFGASRAGRV